MPCYIDSGMVSGYSAIRVFLLLRFEWVFQLPYSLQVRLQGNDYITERIFGHI